MSQLKQTRGRPVTGKAKTNTERVNATNAALKLAGGKIVSRLRLSADAAQALSKLSGQCGSDRAATETALIEHSKRLFSTH